MGDGSQANSTKVDMTYEPGENAEDRRLFRCLNRQLGPNSRLVQTWQVLVVLSIIVDVFLNSFLWAFDSRIRAMWFIVYGMDVIYIINIAVKFFLPYYDKGIVITDRNKIRRHYLKSATFFVDILTMVPLECIALSPALISMKYVAVFRSNRLIRLYAVFVYFKTLGSRLGTNVKGLMVCKFLTIASLVLHLMGCGWYSLGCPGKHDHMDLTCRPESWAVTFNFGHAIEIPSTTTSRAYIISLYWAVTTATSVGYGDLRPVTIAEKWYSIFSMLMGITVFFGIILGGIASQLTNADIERAQYTHRLNVIKKKMRKARVPPAMGEGVIDYYKYLWFRKRGVTDQGLLNKLPITFRAEVTHSANRFILDKVRRHGGIKYIK
ncbi:cyclic nucleotide-gated channel alpha-3-like [Amphiura filiformis]|uniref:cyclic nucleotide-gated channel alpha-3-like n=1 Tax=Amphiura filiformis TaxID=82378 RepID=UPI003B2152BF